MCPHRSGDARDAQCAAAAEISARSSAARSSRCGLSRRALRTQLAILRGGACGGCPNRWHMCVSVNRVSNRRRLRDRHTHVERGDVGLVSARADVFPSVRPQLIAIETKSLGVRCSFCRRRSVGSSRSVGFPSPRTGPSSVYRNPITLRRRTVASRVDRAEVQPPPPPSRKWPKTGAYRGSGIGKVQNPIGRPKSQHAHTHTHTYRRTAAPSQYALSEK